MTTPPGPASNIPSRCPSSEAAERPCSRKAGGHSIKPPAIARSAHLAAAADDPESRYGCQIAMSNGDHAARLGRRAEAEAAHIAKLPAIRSPSAASERTRPASSRIEYPETCEVLRSRASPKQAADRTEPLALESPWGCATGWSAVTRSTPCRQRVEAGRDRLFGGIGFAAPARRSNDVNQSRPASSLRRGARRAKTDRRGRCRAPSRVLAASLPAIPVLAPDRGRAVCGRGRREAAASGAGIPDRSACASKICASPRCSGRSGEAVSPVPGTPT